MSDESIKQQLAQHSKWVSESAPSEVEQLRAEVERLTKENADADDFCGEHRVAA